eukprot:CAMPEP_0179090926 /NCGR_PEP_ID=MMETSP0796-20121207/41507_1 /TAXON_ID=73915 /ORGANISM="Pyrodinium bahamense, Strain pbaha01" /LENGTH=49 /DNA_ID=CAMNT_0020788503 /DNA_START=88 /DNA_END=237 /DNA_ORIENTATION=+
MHVPLWAYAADSGVKMAKLQGRPGLPRRNRTRTCNTACGDRVKRPPVDH